MKRCVETGGAIAQACHVDSEVLTNLHDIDYGLWHGAVTRRFSKPNRNCSHFGFHAAVMRFPEGESLHELVARGADALRLVVKHHSDDTMVLVGHDSVNRAMLLQLLDQPLSAYWRLRRSLCINEIEIAERRGCVVRMNETGHLAGIARD